MKKKTYGRKLSRSRKSRKALWKAIIRALALHGSIITTEAKAKFVQRDIDKIIYKLKSGSLSAVRSVYASFGNDREITEKLKNVSTKMFKDKKGGYTRLTKLPPRRGDLAKIVRLEWSEKIVEEKPKSASLKSGKETAVVRKDKKDLRSKLSQVRSKIQKKAKE